MQIKKYKKLVTNKVWQGFVGYRHYEIEEALANGQDLLCTTKDKPGEFMIVPNFLIERRAYKVHKIVKDRTGWEGRLDYIWWESEQTKVEKKLGDKQLKLI